jgi:hypothetical protein
MAADKVFDLRFGPVVEGVVGRPHVGEFGVLPPQDTTERPDSNE